MLSASNSLNDDGTLAVYNPGDKRVRVRGTEMTPALRVTLVHELTHAAQDQHFDAGRHLDTQGEAAAFRALLEGDAMRIEDRYIDQFSDDERKAYEDQADKDFSDSEAKLTDVPPAVTAYFAAPYTLGRQLVQLLDDQGGNSAVDDALVDP